MLFQLKLVLKNWKSFLLFIAIPLLFLTIGYSLVEKLFDEPERFAPFKMVIVDQDKTVETALVIQQLQTNEQIQKTIEIIQTDEAEAGNLMKSNAIAAIVLIPEGFSKDVRRGVNTPIQVIGNEKRPLQVALIRHLMNSAAYLTSAAQSGINTIFDILSEEGASKKERKIEFKKSVVSFTLHIVGRGEIFHEKQYSHLFQTNIKQYYLLSFYVLLLLVWSFGAMFLLKNEVSATLQVQLELRGVSRFQQMIVEQIVLLIILLIPTFFAGWAIAYYLKLQENGYKMVVASIVIVCIFSTLFMLLHSAVNRLKIYQVSGIFLIIVGTIIGGHFIPPLYFPVWLENVSSYSVNGLALQYMLSIAGDDHHSIIRFFVISGGQLLLMFLIVSLFRKRWRG